MWVLFKDILKFNYLCVFYYDSYNDRRKYVKKLKLYVYFNKISFSNALTLIKSSHTIK